MSLKPVENSEVLNVLVGVVLDCADQGHFVALTLDAGIELQAIMVKSSFLDANLEEGQKVWLNFKKEAIRIIR